MNTPVRTIHSKSPSRRRPCALAAAALAAVLASTACEPNAAQDPSDAKPSDGPSATSSARPGETDDGGSDGDSDIVKACGGADLSFAASKEPADAKELRHIVLTATNTGDKKCTVHRYPYVDLGGRSPVAGIEDSDPGETVTLAPGEEAYAALLVNGGGMDTYDTDTISLGLQGRTPGSEAGEPIGVDLPGTAAFDDGARVTYWTTASGYALDFITSS